ncbi:2-succinyl-5-enolpyruvyl-6-hydroxy-3-cyclohexene-1-carboxylic-acid synthase, partial [bacterium]|nr:2-succinyl-5-enolpyruvyl-6-hydroxy-3-cyclohexene-1-carboxylic-acid synthase [bacterium]
MFSNDEWASLIVSCCEVAGISQFCIAPGSRSTPLTLTVAARSNLTSHIHFEERGLSFFALGLAKSRREPVAIITTSGTAVANLLPAVVEAYYSQVPLLLLTADRPPELIGVGANQAIVQEGIFGGYVRHSVSLPCPEDDKRMDEIINSLWAASKNLENGPVHINIPFREPLFMVESQNNFVSDLTRNNKHSSQFKKLKHESVTVDTLERGVTDFKVLFNGTTIKTSKKDVERRDNKQDIEIVRPHLNRILTSSNWVNESVKKPLIILGECSKEDYKIAIELAVHFSIPILIDVLSSYKSGDYHCKIDQYDWFIDLPKYDYLKPDFVIWIGGRVLSKKLHQWIPKKTKILQFSQLLYPINPENNSNLIKISDKLNDEIKIVLENNLDFDLHKDWCLQWVTINGKVNAIIRTSVEMKNFNHEPSIYAELFRMISIEFPSSREQNRPSGVNLFLANSSPIRHAATFLNQQPIQLSNIFANRGGSGIDGIVSSISGYSSGSKDPLIAIVGDLSFFHDLSSLLLLGKLKTTCVLIVINNNGGGLFSWLPVQKSKFFTKYFKTP